MVKGATRQGAFTLIEVLVSIALLSLVLLGLYRTLEIQRQSNRQLREHFEKIERRNKVVMTLYRDLLSSDGNLSISKGEFDRLCIEHTRNSLYGLCCPKVCWVVLREGKSLVRVEGNGYRLPLREEDSVAADPVMKSMELFDLYRKKGALLVVMKSRGGKAYTFLIKGLEKPSIPSNPKEKKHLP